MSRHQDRTTSPRTPYPGSRIPNPLHDVHAALCAQLAALLDAEVVRSKRTDWFSVTFAGARHQIVLRTAASPARLAELPEHEFALPGAFVADLAVMEADGELVTVEALVVRE